MKLQLNKIRERQIELAAHPLLNGKVNNIDKLQVFMEHHQFAVWDFMSLLKALQHHVCPSTLQWVPTRRIRSGAARLINEIVLNEESDMDIDGKSPISHHDLYVQSMLEIGADPRVLEELVNFCQTNTVWDAFEKVPIPYPALKFMQKTFGFIETGEPHIIAAAFCFGRETAIPVMFRHLADHLKIRPADAPKFHYYLERHIDIDGEEHGPASIQLVESLCDDDPVKIHEAEQAGLQALRYRYEFWTDVLEVLEGDLNPYRSDIHD
jgi:hypothetical protein